MTISDIETDRLATVLRALSHPARIDIVRTLAHAGDAQCLDLTRHVELSQSTVSEHLRVLKEAGLIEQCGPGHRSSYCVNREMLRWVKKTVGEL